MLKPMIRKVFSDKPSLPIIIAIIASMMIGLSPIFVRVSEVGPIATAFYRFFFALPFLWGWMITENSKTGMHTKHPSSLEHYVLLLIAGVLLACDIALWHWSLSYTSVANAGILNNLTSVFVLLIAWLFLKEDIDKLTLVGIGCAAIGSIILVGKNFTSSGESFLGDILALASALFYTGYIIIVKKLRRYFSTPTIMSWGALASLYFFAFLSFFSGDVLFPSTPTGWYELMGLALVVHIFGQGLLAYSIGHLSASFSGLILLVGPVTSASVAWIMFDESMSGMQILGASIVLAGIVIARSKK